LAKDRKAFFETERTLLRKIQLQAILPEVPLLVSSKGEVFLVVMDYEIQAQVKFVIDGVRQDEEKRLAFTHKKIIKFR
jgi:hypothetical protein